MNDLDRRDPPDPALEPLLAALPREAGTPPGLEDRTMRRLRAAGRRRRVPAIAAAAAIFVAGLAAGLAAGPLLVPSSPTDASGGFLLLLYEDGAYVPAAPGAEAQRVAEYGSWARDLAARGIAISGERLGDGGISMEERNGTVVRLEAAGDRLGGFFLVRVATRIEAERIAATCPHLRYGGRVAVRAVLPT